MGTCNRCGAEIEWVKTQNDKNMPIDPDGVDIDQLEDEDMVADENGRVTKKKFRSNESQQFWRSHFDTCEDRHGPDPAKVEEPTQVEIDDDDIPF